MTALILFLLVLQWRINVALNDPIYKELKETLEGILNTLINRVNGFTEFLNSRIKEDEEQLLIYLNQCLFECRDAEEVRDALEVEVEKKISKLNDICMDQISDVIEYADTFVWTALNLWQTQCPNDGVAAQIISDFVNGCARIRDELTITVQETLNKFREESQSIINIIEEVYIANLRSKEIHKLTCGYVGMMDRGNKWPCLNFGQVYSLVNVSGYNGCYYCLKQYDTDSLSLEQVMVNLADRIKTA